SWNAVQGQLGMSVLFGLVASLVVLAYAVACGGIGFSVLFGLLDSLVVLAYAVACGIGLIVSVPLTVLAISVLYRDFFLAGAPAAGPPPPGAPPGGGPDTPPPPPL